MDHNIFGYTLTELQQICVEAGLERYRGEQLFYWLYSRRVDDLAVCRNIPKSGREALAARFFIRKPDIRHELLSTDGTRKYLFGLNDGRAVETVLIPSESEEFNQPKRLTICVSTQVGCPLDCRFCATASMKLRRNLTTGEILGQYFKVQKAIDTRITNLVFMGMGEPLLNYDGVMKAVDIVTREKTGGIPASRITLSTAGLPDGIRRLADEDRKIKLAVSLHATTDTLRTRLMPINKKYPLAELIDAIEYYYHKTRMRVTYEYIMFDGLNDRPEDIRHLVKLTRRVPSKINIIPFHPIEIFAPDPRLSLVPTPRARIEEFAEELRRKRVTVMLRSSSGKDIEAACGQLAIRQPLTV